MSQNNMFDNKYVLYIGANNKTGLVEKERIVSIVSQWFDGFTVIDSLGYWMGAPENSVTVTIYTSGDTCALAIEKMVQELIKELNQNSILVEHNGKGELVY